MQQPGPLRQKSYAFALRIIQFCKKLQLKEKEFVLAKQLLKSGTSIGANVEEASQAQSRPDFISKLAIALKESHETHYWLRLINDSVPSLSQHATELLQELNEVIALLTAILKTTRSRS